MTDRPLPATFRINEPDIVADSVDGELLVINLSTGTYYSGRGPADAAWPLLAAGRSTDEIAVALAAAYATDPRTVAVDIVPWLHMLLDEEIVVGTAEPAPGACPDVPPRAGGWSAPMLEKFTDMQDLLLLDPVHEVADAGWPHAPGPS